jgi:S-adenosylmethionine:tRNA ribosyltransferase-isomerase
MMELPKLAIADFQYPLPDERIAKYPLPVRDQSKLLVWQNGAVAHRRFFELPDLLEGNEILFFNNTRVIPARLYFRKETGGLIEVFLLSPSQPALVEQAMYAGPGLRWHCTIGNLKRWKDGQILHRELNLNGQQVELRIELIDRERQEVRFDWDQADLPFVQLIEAAGNSPIPPYLNRQAEERDKDTYQTVYSKKEGAVAAPTAGLHFTPEVLNRIDSIGCRREELTLHVSAGTFRPVKSENAVDHDMHSEQIILTRANLEALLGDQRVVCVGTTSMRTLESIYWYGVHLLDNPNAEFVVEKLAPYQYGARVLPSRSEAVSAVLKRMDQSGLDRIQGSTEIYIFPGYTFRVVDGLITNFHQPGSTLLLLIAAFTGGNTWKEIYEEAMQNDYRFLSYGDSSFLWRQ